MTLLCVGFIIDMMMGFSNDSSIFVCPLMFFGFIATIFWGHGYTPIALIKSFTTKNWVKIGDYPSKIQEQLNDLNIE